MSQGVNRRRIVSALTILGSVGLIVGVGVLGGAGVAAAAPMTHATAAAPAVTVAPAPGATVAPTPTTQRTASVPATAGTDVVRQVVLTAVGPTSGPSRTYVANVIDGSGGAIAGADLDLGALGSDPDDRVPTVPMTADPQDPTRYGATVSFPAAGDWVLVVRVHAPSRYVHLGREKVDVGALPVSHDSPSRAALRAAAPGFAARYDPYTGVGATGREPTPEAVAAAAADGHGSGITASGDSATDRHTADGLVTTIVVNLLHVGGAAAWILGMAGLSLGRRLRPSTASSGVVRAVADRYGLLVGGGLAAVVVSGLMNLERATPTGFDVEALLSTGLGQLYFGVLAFKVALAASSVMISVQIGSLLRRDRTEVPALSLRSVGAAARLPAGLQRALRLADVNMVMATLILVCVVVLSNVHRALH